VRKDESKGDGQGEPEGGGEEDREDGYG